MTCPGCGGAVIPGRRRKDAAYCTRKCRGRWNSRTRSQALAELALIYPEDYERILVYIRRRPA